MRLGDIKILFQVVKYTVGTWLLMIKGQQPRYEILMLSHKLEKGLLNENPKHMWGWDKAHRLAHLIKQNNDSFSCKTGESVLAAYLDNKERSADEEEKRIIGMFSVNNLIINKIERGRGGGVRFIDKADVITSEESKNVIERFFNSRHSVRDYSAEKVKRDDLEAAISLAMRCPSACNRQPTKCYIYQSDEQQTIFVTVNVRAFNCSEFNDWFVSPSIFAAYLSLTLHLYGIGSCIYRKQLYGNDPYNKKMKAICGIPNDEMIVLELKFGYYKETFGVACSNRASCDDITSFVNV